MTNEELVQLYQAGDKQALEELLVSNKGFIHKVIKKFYIGHDHAIDYDDLLQEGRIGMIKAADKYKSDMDVNFLSYAYYWIYQSMHRFMYPSRAKRESTLKFVSLNVPVGDEGETELGDILADDKDEFCNVEESIYYQDLHREIHVAINESLNDRQKQVIFMRYGFDCNVHTLEQAGEVLGVTRERTRQIEVKSLRLLRTSKWGRIRMAEYYAEYEKRCKCEKQERDQHHEKFKQKMEEFEIEKKILHDLGLNAYIIYI